MIRLVFDNGEEVREGTIGISLSVSAGGVVKHKSMVMPEDGVSGSLIGRRMLYKRISGLARDLIADLRKDGKI